MGEADHGKQEDTSTGDQITDGSKIVIGGDVGPGAVVAGRDAYVTIQQPSPLVVQRLHQLPAPPRDFTGREAELAELLAKVQEGGVTITGLRGLGGIGKTALALVLAERLTASYPDAQFYLDLKGAAAEPLTPAAAMAHVVQAYHPTAKLPEGEADLRDLYCSVLHGQRALVLMDNAADRSQVELLVPPPSCLLLVTSRQHFTLPGLYAKNLNVLPEGDAQGLLLQIEPRINGHAGELAKLCGYLPLALRAAGTLLAIAADMAPATYVEQLRDERTRLERIGQEGVNASVEASLTFSCQHLDEQAARVFCALSVFTGTFDANAEEAVCQDPGHTHLSKLVRYSLVDYDQATKRYRLHDLARVFAGQRLAEAERVEAQQRHAAHYERVLRSARDLYMQGGDNVLRGLALFDLEWPNIQAGQAWAAANAGIDDTATRLCSKYPDWPFLLELRLHPRERIRWMEEALAAARRLKHREAEGVHLGNLGLAYADLGDYRRAIEFHEQALVISREIGDRRGEGQDLGNLGSAYLALGDYRRAIELYEQRIVIAREIGDRRGEGLALMNTGSAHYGLGDARKATQYWQQASAIFEEIGDVMNAVSIGFNLAVLLAQQGRFAEALPYAERAAQVWGQIGHAQYTQQAQQLVAKIRAAMR